MKIHYKLVHEYQQINRTVHISKELKLYLQAQAIPGDHTSEDTLRRLLKLPPREWEEHDPAMRDFGKPRCQWPNCDQRQHLPRQGWGCRPHWQKLPKHLRDAFRRTHQRVYTGLPAELACLAAQRTLNDIQSWIEENYPPTRS